MKKSISIQFLAAVLRNSQCVWKKPCLKIFEKLYFFSGAILLLLFTSVMELFSETLNLHLLSIKYLMNTYATNKWPANN